MNWKKNAAALSSLSMARRFKSLSDYDMEAALRLLGLARRRRTSARFFTGLGLVLGGVAVGAAIGMALAPKAGQRMGRTFPGAMGKQPGYGTQPVNVGSQGSNFS